MKALELTTTSWILHDTDGSKLGLLTKTATKYKLITKEGVVDWASLTELEQDIGKIKFKERKIKENKNLLVAGYPTDEEEIFDVDEVGEIPSYKKTEKGKARYAPGYWGIKFSVQYVPSFCPKITTLQTYEHIGPFKEKFILNDEMTLANRKLNDEHRNESST